MTAKPRLTAYVAHNNDDLDHDVFYTLATALEQPWRFCEATLEAEKHTIHLRPDIHRDNACACAVLVVHDATGVDEATRLAALHARREGVHRFILLIEERQLLNGRTDLVERDARTLLESLGVDGNDAPAIRSPLTRGVGRLSEPMHAGMRSLLAALDDLPAFLEPAPLRITPPKFTAEAALLDAVHPLLAPATRLEREVTTLATTTTLHAGSGGSYLGGAPYLEQREPWPNCPRCTHPLAGVLQVDNRDLLHGAPPAHGLFVLFTCTNNCGIEEIRHHADPRSTRRRTEPPSGTNLITDRPSLLRPTTRCWLLPDREVLASEHPDVAARLCTLSGMDDPLPAYDRIAAAMGVASLQVSAHFGGHHATDVGTPTPRCDVCAALCALVVQVDAGDDHRSLWACRDHPSSSFHLVHP